MKKMSLVAGLLGVIVMNSAVAGNRPEAVTLSLGGAYYHFSDTRNLQNPFMPNLALAYNFTDRWAIEGGLGNINTDQKNGGTSSVHGMLYTVDGIYRFTPKNRFEPYVIAGVGVLNLKPTPGTSSQYQSNINAGLGTQFFADRIVALRGEVRDLYTMAGRKNDIMVNFGVSFVFGGV